MSAKRDAAASQKRLLDAAEREFAARGYAGARLRAVAEGAGAPITLVHHYFGDKTGLYKAVLDRLLAPAQQASWSLLQASPDLDGLARGFVELLTKLFSEHRALLDILRHEAAQGSSVLGDVLRDRMAPIAQGALQILRDMMARGEVRSDIAPEEIVSLTVSMIAYPFVDSVVLDAVLPSSPSTYVASSPDHASERVVKRSAAHGAPRSSRAALPSPDRRILGVFEDWDMGQRPRSGPAPHRRLQRSDDASAGGAAINPRAASGHPTSEQAISRRCDTIVVVLLRTLRP